MFSLDKFNQNYDTDVVNISIANRAYRFYVPKTLEPFINDEEPMYEFPLWAKIWEASIVLAGKLANMNVDSSKEYLEVGCGVGMVGIVTATFGHRVTMTEYDSHAVEFAKANVELNQCPDIQTMTLDWSCPTLNKQFDYIVASEIIYKESDIAPLKQLFQNYLKPDGEIILAGEMRSTNMEFFTQMDSIFNIQIEKKIIRTDNEKTRIILPRMRFKSSQ